MRAALLAGVALTALAGVMPAAAQQAGGSTQLDQIDVQGRGAGGPIGNNGSGTAPVQGIVPTATTTGSKTDTPIALIPQSIGVVGREQMDLLGANKPDEAIRYSAGVFTQPFGDDSDNNWFYIRGFDATQTGVYRDGMQLYNFAFGNFYTDSYLLERVEVLRGASSSLYGGGAIGGILNYVSKRPLDADFGQIEVGIDNYPTAFAAFDVNKVIPNDLVTKGDPLPSLWKYRVTGKIEGGDGYSKHEDGWRGVIQGAATYSPDAGTDLTVYANYQHMDQTHGGGDFLPYYGTVKKTQFGRIDRDENFSEPDLDKFERQQAMAGYELNTDINETWKAQSKARFAYAHIEEVQLFPFGYQGPPSVPGGPDTGFNPMPDGRNLLTRSYFGHDTTVYSVTTDNNLVGKFATGGLDHTVLFGVDYKLYTIDQAQSGIRAAGGFAGTPINANDPQYGTDQLPRTTYLDESTSLNQLGVYAQDQIRFGGGFIATFNGRYDRVWIDSNFKEIPDEDTGEDKTLEKGRFSGRAGLGYEFQNGVVPYVSVASTFNPILGSYNTAEGRQLFKPETGIQYEAGVKYAPTWFPGLFSAAIFDLTKDNVLTGPFNAQRQLGQVRSRGVEFEAQANLTENWKFLGSFTAYELEITKDLTGLKGEQPFLVPEVIGSAFLDYTFTTGALKGLGLGGGVRYIGSSEATQPNTVKVPSVTLFDAAARYEWENYKISLNVTNLLDKRYVSGCQGILVCSYGEARKAMAKVSYTW